MKQLSTTVLLFILIIGCKEKSAGKSTAAIRENTEPKVANKVTKTASHI